MTDGVTTEFPVLLADLSQQQRRIETTKFLDGKVQKELGSELLPNLIALAEHFNERLEHSEALCDEILNQTESFVQPELAKLIFLAFDAADKLCKVVLGFKEGDVIDGLKLKTLKNLVSQVGTTMNAASAAVTDVAVTEEGDEDEEQPSEADGEEARGAQVEAAPSPQEEVVP